MNINENNNPIVHVCTMGSSYIDFHFPRKGWERVYICIEFWRRFGITIGIYGSKSYSPHCVIRWKRLRFSVRPLFNREPKDVFSIKVY